MKIENPNLFESLIVFHPKENHTPKENFLTESLVYILRTNEVACTSFLSLFFLEKKVNYETCEFETRPSGINIDSNTYIFPDLKIRGQFSTKRKFLLIFEHKWDAECNPKQLIRYYKSFVESEGQKAKLIFIGQTQKQVSIAKNAFKKNQCACFQWGQVYEKLNDVPKKSVVLREFLGFMESRGLSPGKPLTSQNMKWFLQSYDKANGKVGSEFKGLLLNLANKLEANYSWEDGVIPKRYIRDPEKPVKDAWGRVGIRFQTSEFKPAFTIGFYYNGEDHKVPLINENSIDLFLRIEAMPGDSRISDIGPVLKILKEKQKEFRKIGAVAIVKGQQVNWNNYSILTVQFSFLEIASNCKTVNKQLDRIYALLVEWLKILFEDGALEKGFKESGLDSK